MNEKLASIFVPVEVAKLAEEKDYSRYYVRFRNIPFEMMFTPTYLISIDHIQVNAKKDANEWDLKIAICQELGNLNYKPDDIRFESKQEEITAPEWVVEHNKNQ